MASRSQHLFGLRGNKMSMDEQLSNADHVATAVELSAQLAEVSSNSDLSKAMRKLNITDPLLDLCPSVETLQRIVHIDEKEMGKEYKTDRLKRALLRTANSGDADLLAWILHPESGVVDLLPTVPNQRKPAKARVAGIGTHSPETGARIVSFEQIRDEDGNGPVNLAASSGNLEVVRLLISQGADVNERDACGWTPLMWASNSSNVPLASFLLSQGADVDARSYKGTSCEDFILSVAPESLSLNSFGSSEANSAFHSSFSHAGPSRLPLRPFDDNVSPGGLRPPIGGSLDNTGSPSSPSTSRRNSDRELIADMIMEHQKAKVEEKRKSASGLTLEQGLIGGLRIHNADEAGASSSARSLAPSPLIDDASPRSASPSSSSVQHSLESESQGSNHGKGMHRRVASLASTGTRRLLDRSERVQLAEQELRARELAEGRKRALLDIAVMLEIDFEALVGDPPPTPNASSESDRARRRRMRIERKAGLASGKKLVHSGLASGCGALEVGGDPLSEEFDFEKVQPDQMLVFGRADVSVLIDFICVKARPVRAPWTARATPANLLFLCGRYACSYDDEELLEDLMANAIDKIEESVYEHPMDMAWLTFWTFNCTLLLHYFQTDTVLAQSEAAGEYQTLLTDLINEIYVFIIRDTERRVDKVLDAAMLEHDSLPLSDVKFEGDWNFMKSLAGSVKSMGSSSTPNQSSPQRRPLSQIFSSSSSVAGSPKINNTPASSGLATPPQQKGSLSSSPHKRAPSELNLVSIRETSATASASDLLARPSPRTITTLLTSTLQVLQLFEVNPAIIVQVLSQVLFWVGCELFNRVLGNKKYLCRSKAMQIRLNVSALEDWARSNALPLAIVHQHLAPLSQLVSWLQCQSALSDFDGLITTLQGLKALNPLQLRKAVRDYRYEMNESRMSEECLQYLLQLHEDWDRSVEQHLLRQLHKRPTSHVRDRTATQQNPHGADVEPLDDMTLRSSPEALDLSEEEKASRHAQMAVDSLFEPGSSMADYMPPWTPLGRPGPNGELVATADKVNSKSTIVRDLLNSREMLPFALPTSSSALIVSPGDAFNFGRGHFNGTGTPGLKSLHALSPRFPQAHRALHGSLARLSGSPSVSGSQRGEDDSDSVISANTGSSASSRQSLFSNGNGFGAGSSWRAVPLLPEGLLETVDALCRSQRPAVESRLSNLAAWGSPTISITPSSTLARNATISPRNATMSPEIGESGDAERSTDSSETAKYGQLGSGWEESSTKAFGHARHVSTFSAKPLRLAIPDRTRRTNSLNGAADDDEDAVSTPVRANLPASPERIAV